MIQILLEPEFIIEPGHQWLVLSDTKEGQALAILLTADGSPIVRRGNQLLVPHDDLVDRRIVALINELANARYQSPALVQLTMEEVTE